MDFIGSVRAQLHAHGMAPKGSRVLAAVSGGPDSMAMLVALSRLRRAMRFELGVAHINHGLRRSAAREAALVAGFAAELGLPACRFTVRRDLAAAAAKQGRSLEELARRTRYDALARLARDHGWDRIATGHTASDQAETVLMRVVSGTGIDGLAGILPVRAEGPLTVIRPLLTVARRDVEAFVRLEKLPFCTDETNREERFHRNRVRRRLLPLIERELNPSAVFAIARLAGNAREHAAFVHTSAQGALSRVARMAVPGRAVLRRGRYCDLPPPVRAAVLAMILDVAAPACRLDRDHIEAVAGLAAAGRTGASLDLPGRVTASVTRLDIVLTASGTTSGTKGRAR